MKTNAPHVVVVPAIVPDAGCVWRCTEVHGLTGDENHGRHNVFIRLYRDGIMVYDGFLIQYGWDGQRPDEAQQPKKPDKKPPDPSTDIAIETGMHMWVEVVDPNGCSSDRVRNLHAELVSDGAGNEYHHHSYDIRFDLVQGDTVEAPDELTVLRAKLAAIKALVNS